MSRTSASPIARRAISQEDTPAPARWRIPASYTPAQLVVAVRHAKSHPLDTYTPYVHDWPDHEMSAAEYLRWFRRTLHEKISAACSSRHELWQTHVSIISAKGHPTRAQAAGRQPGGPSSYMLLPAGTPLRLVGRASGRIRENEIGVYQALPCGSAGAACYLRLSAIEVQREMGSIPVPRESRKLRADYQITLVRDAQRLRGYGGFGRRLETPEVRERLGADHVHIYMGGRVVLCAEGSEQECA